MQLTFLGAAQTVTGSRFLVQHENLNVLVDCGLFQGPRRWKEENWKDFPVRPDTIDCIILTHAHIDHSGYLPRLHQLGFQGPVFCTPPTAELLGLMLPDSGHLQEEDASFANKKKYTRHDPALPLYTEEQARRTLDLLQPVDLYSQQKLSPHLSFTFLRAGHILGSAMIELKFDNRKLVFSGDLGRPSQFITKSPDQLRQVDHLVLESTYGNRLHQRVDVRQHLAEIITRTASDGGSLLVPAFAIGRTQELLFLLRGLLESKQIPHLPIFIDSPMAIHAIGIYDRHPVDSSKALEALAKTDPTPFVYPPVTALKTVEESMTLNEIRYPAIIISSSGMATGGRILHHLKRRIGDHRNTVLFIGFQAEGTKGRFLVEGAEEIKIHGKQYKAGAQIEYLDALSCHADYEEMLSWLGSLEVDPRAVFLVHGEETAAHSMAEKIRGRYHWNCVVPNYRQSYDLK